MNSFPSLQSYISRPPRPRFQYPNNNTGPVQILPLFSVLCTNTRAVCKVRELTLLIQVGTLWSFGDGLLFEVPPLASDALLTTLHPLFEISRSGLYGGNSNGVPPIHFFQTEHRIQFRSRPHVISGLFQP
jgi:hypothetical protein